MKERIRVAVDVTSLIGAPTGVGVMVGRLVDGLVKRDDLTMRGFAVSWRGRDRLPSSIEIAQRFPMAARPLRTLWSRMDVPPVELWTGATDVVHDQILRCHPRVRPLV